MVTLADQDVVSKADLAALLGNGKSVRRSALPRHISAIREKLPVRLAPATVPGFGYALTLEARERITEICAGRAIVKQGQRAAR